MIIFLVAPCPTFQGEQDWPLFQLRGFQFYQPNPTPPQLLMLPLFYDFRQVWYAMNVAKKVWPDQPCILSITLESLVGRHTQLWMVDTECSSYFTKRSTWFCIKTFLTRRSRDSRLPRPSLVVVLVPLWSLEVADSIEFTVQLFFKIAGTWVQC